MQRGLHGCLGVEAVMRQAGSEIPISPVFYGSCCGCRKPDADCGCDLVPCPAAARLERSRPGEAELLRAVLHQPVQRTATGSAALSTVMNHFAVRPCRLPVECDHFPQNSFQICSSWI